MVKETNKTLVTAENTKENSAEPSSAKIFIKVSALWHFVEWYLEMLSFTGAILDEEFSRYYKQLSDYVHSKIQTGGSDILAEYVVYEIEQ